MCWLIYPTNIFLRNVFVGLKEGDNLSNKPNAEYYKRIAKMLSSADRCPNLEAARRGKKAQDEYHAHIISEYNVGATTYVRTTALNLDIESLIAESWSKTD